MRARQDGIATDTMQPGDRKRLFRQTALALAMLLSLIFAYVLREAASGHGSFLLDFRAFYCSASVARAGADPYRAEPLGTCERKSAANTTLAKGGFVVPAPLPGWAILLLEPLARLPFATAAFMWWTLLVAAFVLLQLQVARCFGGSLNAIAVLVFLFPLALVVPEALGQPVTVSIALLFAAALLLRLEKDRAAAVLAATATLEVHIALPVCLALFVARPKTRSPLLLSAAVLMGLSVAALGIQENLEYVLRVLPAQIAAESDFRDQYSATYAAMALHASRGAAIVIGQASYWLLAFVSVGLARSYATAGRDPELIVFVPMALSVLGGPYVHVEHLLAAVPFALYVLARCGRSRWSVALVLLIAWPLRTLLQLSGNLHSINLVTPPVAVNGQTLLAEASWAAAIGEQQGSLVDTLTKIPSWIGLILLAAIAIAIARRERIETPLTSQSESP